MKNLWLKIKSWLAEILFVLGVLGVGAVVMLGNQSPCATDRGDAGVRVAIENKSPQEKANIKGKEIAKLKCIKKTSFSGKYFNGSVEIKDFKAIEGGVEFLARAWDGQGKQIGFGDGSVEWERFRIYNPPVLVDDPNGNIVRTFQERQPDGTLITKERRLREDLREAVLQTLEHIIAVKKEKHGSEKIIRGKIGNTTSTFHPDPGTGTTSVDGGGQRDIGNPGQTFSALRSGAATHVHHTGTTLGVALQNASTGNNKIYWERALTIYDTSPIPDDDDITSATISLRGSSKSDGNSSQWGAAAKEIKSVSGASASNTTLATGDFIITNFGTTEFAKVTHAGWSTTAYNDFVLNASGISNISKTGVSKFGFLIGAEFDNVDPGPGASNGFTGIYAFSADESGTSKDPKLVVEHSAVSAENPSVNNFIKLIE